MDGALAGRGRRRVSGARHGLPPGDGRPWPLPPALSRLRCARAADRPRGERDELLSPLPDGRDAPRRPRALAPAEGGLAATAGGARGRGWRDGRLPARSASRSTGASAAPSRTAVSVAP